jgi:hypothetical protein
MTSDGRRTRGFAGRSTFGALLQAGAAARELGGLGLLDALDYLVMLAAEAPERYERAARRWLSRLLAESDTLTADEVAVATGCLRGLPEGYEEEQWREVLRAILKRKAPVWSNSVRGPHGRRADAVMRRRVLPKSSLPRRRRR